MPGLIQQPEFEHITVKELHPTFVAEIQGVDFSQTVAPEVFNEIYRAITTYGVCVFRGTALDDTRHVEFSRLFGDLDNIKRYLANGRKPRFPYYELFDAGNLDENGRVLAIDSERSHYNKGNGLWHVDSSFNPRRASYSLLLANTIPPPGNGGNTDFADTRTAFDDLPSALKEELLEKDYLAAHSLFHSRKLGSPEYFKDLNPLDHKMYKHRLVQKHEPSGRMNLYIANHAHHIEGVSSEKSEKLIKTLLEHCTQDKYTVSVPWERPGDLVIWDNRCVMHKAGGGSYAGKYARDMRRTTVHDDSSTAWGVNEQNLEGEGFIISDKATKYSKN